MSILKLAGMICGTSLALAACENSDRAPMGGQQAVNHAPYRGAVPQEFRNQADAAALEAQGAATAVAAGPALAAFSLAAEVPAFGVADPAAADDGAAKIPDVNHCQSLTSLMGPMLERAYAAQVLGAGLAETDEGTPCSAAFAPLGVGFPNVIAALRGQLATVTQLGLSADECTAVNKIDRGGPDGAVRVELSPKTAEPGAYLAGFTLDRFVAGLDGGAAEGNLALRGEVEVRANAAAPVTGARVERYQWAGIGSLIAPGAQSITSERREIWSATLHGNPVVTETMIRDTMVTLGLGPTPSLDESTQFVTTSGTGAQRTRTVKATALPNADDGLGVDVTIQDGAQAPERRYRIEMIPRRGLEPFCTVAVLN